MDKSGNLRNGTTKIRKPPKDSSINREVTMIQEWFKHMLVPEKIAIAAPSIEKTKVRRVDLTANPPFTPSDYTKIQRRFRKWSDAKTTSFYAVPTLGGDLIRKVCRQSGIS